MDWENSSLLEANDSNSTSKGKDNKQKQKFCHVSPELAKAIVSVYAYFEQERIIRKHQNVMCPVKRTAEALGVSSWLILEISKRVDLGGKFLEVET